MATGHVEPLKRGFRAVVYAGKDPITGRKTYIKETHPTRDAGERAKARLVATSRPSGCPTRRRRSPTCSTRWMEVADHELTTRETNEGYIRRTLTPALGDMTLRKLQHRVDILDRLYTHLRRCGALCDGRPFVEHRLRKGASLDGGHDCGTAACAPHRCKQMSPGAVRRIHAIVSAPLNYAVSWGWIERNPAQHAHPPKLNRRRPAPPEPDLVAGQINRAWQDDPEFGLYLWLAVTTGARRGELAALRWASCDFERGELLLDDNYVVRSGEGRIKGTKTDNPRRLSLDSLTVQLLTDFHTSRGAHCARSVSTSRRAPSSSPLTRPACVPGTRTTSPAPTAGSPNRSASRRPCATCETSTLPSSSPVASTCAPLSAGWATATAARRRCASTPTGSAPPTVGPPSSSHKSFISFARTPLSVSRLGRRCRPQRLRSRRGPRRNPSKRSCPKGTRAGSTASRARIARSPTTFEQPSTREPSGPRTYCRQRALAAWYGVSQGTAHRALGLLSAEGRLVLRPGARTRVASGPS